MKKLLWLTLLITDSVFALTTTQVVEKSEHMTFRVIVPITGSMVSTGTGFVINKDGYLITNNHVVKGGKTHRIIIKNKFDSYKNIIPIKTYPKRDIAILKIENYHGGFLKLQDPRTIKKGEEIFPLGFPGAADLLEGLTFNASLSKGIISKIDHADRMQYENNYTFIQIDAVINHGNSGGPLLNKNASVVGINTLGNGAKNVQGVFWSIHAKELIRTLKENNITYTIDRESLEQEDITKNIWYSLGILAIILVILFIIVLKRKNITSNTNEREISYLVREKLIKYLPVVDKPDAVKKDETRLMQLMLVSSDKNLPQIRFSNKKELCLGRSNACDIVIKHGSVSSKHLKFLIQGNVVQVTDLDSTNGTYIDGKKLTPNKRYTLEKSQQLLIGSADVVYEIQGKSPQAKTLLHSLSPSNPHITKAGILGRSDESDIVVKNSSVSRKHLKIEESQGKLYITDLNSANGTYINGKKLQPNKKIELPRGIKVVIGSEDTVYEHR